MNRGIGSILIAISIVTSMPAAAQWLNVPTKGIPRTKDGKPDLSAPAPRKPDGKPDLAGIWHGDRQNNKYGPGGSGLATDFKPGEFPIQPWAEALTKERMTGAHASEYPGANCLPSGIPIIEPQPGYPLKIIQEPDLFVILYEVYGVFRQIFLDGRTLPRDPNPTWFGLLGGPLGWGYISSRNSRVQWQNVARPRRSSID